MNCLIGIDIGGTKTAAGLLALPAGEVLARRRQPTMATRGGEAVLADVIAQARSLQDEANGLRLSACAVGIGIAELVSPNGVLLSQDTIRWKDLEVAPRIARELSVPAVLEADVRAAALAEAELGAGHTLRSFLYVTVGTGISACLVLNGTPYTGFRGLAGSFASSTGLFPADTGELVAGPALERFSGGPALAARLAARLLGFAGDAPEAIALAEAGNAQAQSVVDSAGGALGAAIAQLVNILDPEAIVIGGGLGLAGGRYLTRLEESLRAHIYSDCHRDLPLVNARLGVDAGWIGAALSANNPRQSTANHDAASFC